MGWEDNLGHWRNGILSSSVEAPGPPREPSGALVLARSRKRPNFLTGSGDIMVDRNLHFSTIRNETYHGTNNELRKLPAELSTLPKILKAEICSWASDGFTMQYLEEEWL
ncbi:hypothetical protein L1987_32666 [Smallanthus sonchifolius]|uniref:Uncharacterized protein n=1 Tax=Smallanthus sonchifolius TaxID=185202 RepID=A0ACB9HND2_9ASTR|nr:hypothetical protein L1987_32666 [Smallanthus sonchifolius]